MKAHVRVEAPDAAPFEQDLDAPEVVVGRVSSAGLVVPDSSVSRQHARLFQRDGRWWAEDLGATNGTLLNDHPLRKATALSDGDRLKVGGTIVHFGPPASKVEEPGAATGSATLADADAANDRQAARLRTLNEIHRALATPISLSELLDLILERSFGVLRPEEGVILLKEADGELRPAATRRLPGTTGDVFVSRRIVDEVAGKQKPALVLDAALDERFSGSQSIMMSGVRSVVAAPLCDAEGTIGMIALCSRASVRQFSDQDLDMLVSLASAAALRVRNVALAEEAAARKVLERELALAHDMQMAMLPRRMPACPEVDMAASLTPARSVGGDLYDFLEEEDGLWFIVADVSGKGVGAALYMAVVKTLFRATAQGASGLADVMARMNRELCRDNDQMMFITAIVGRLTLATGDVVLSDAGHNPAFLIDPRGQLTEPAIAKSIAFGVMDDAVFGVTTIRLVPGSTLLLYTDGATDARNPGGQLYGADRLREAVRVNAGKTTIDLVEGTRLAVEHFVAGAPPEDDLTLLAIEWRGKGRRSDDLSI